MDEGKPSWWRREPGGPPHEVEADAARPADPDSPAAQAASTDALPAQRNAEGGLDAEGGLEGMDVPDEAQDPDVVALRRVRRALREWRDEDDDHHGGGEGSSSGAVDSGGDAGGSELPRRDSVGGEDAAGDADAADGASAVGGRDVPDPRVAAAAQAEDDVDRPDRPSPEGDRSALPRRDAVGAEGVEGAGGDAVEGAGGAPSGREAVNGTGPGRAAGGEADAEGGEPRRPEGGGAAPQQGGHAVPPPRPEPQPRPAPGNPYAAPGAPPRQGGPGPWQQGPQGPQGPQGQRPGGGPPPPQWQRYDPWNAPPPAVAAQQPRRRRLRAVVAAVVIALLAGGVGGAIGSYVERNGGTGQVELDQPGVKDGEVSDDAPGSVAGIAKTALPGVVTLRVAGSAEQSTGTGFVLDGKGHILTNNHVVQPAESGGEITVTFSEGETSTAEVVGGDAGYDLAVVRVKGVSGLKPLPLGNSDSVEVGDPVVAIGAPFDLPNTVTSGIISAKERPITAGGDPTGGSDVSYVNALQTDAPINPGNSGGPLMDSKGRVIGINSAIRAADGTGGGETEQGGSIGLGFAIPVNKGKEVAEELINTGKATHPVIGVTLNMQYTGDGAEVGTTEAEGNPPVTPGGPADDAGIEPGDVITAVDGEAVHNGEELIVKIRSQRPGDTLTLTVERDGDEQAIDVTLGSGEAD